MIAGNSMVDVTQEGLAVGASLHLIDGALHDGRVVEYLAATGLEGDNLLVEAPFGEHLQLWRRLTFHITLIVHHWLDLCR